MGEWIPDRRFLFLVLTVLVVAAASVSFGVSPASAAGAWRETPDDTWSTNGTVFDTQLSEDGRTLYLGGRFTLARENAPGTPGSTAAVQHLAAIDVATGNVVRTWRPRVGGENAVVRELAVANGKVYVGGNFTSVDGVPRTHLAAVNAANGALDPNFAPAVATTNSTVPTVFAMTADSSRLYVGGRFNTISGKGRNQLAAFSLATGAVDTAWKPKATREVYDLAFSSDGATIFVGGRFGSVTGSDNVSATRKNVARLDTNTGNVHPWTIPAGVIGETNQTAHDLLVTPTRLYAGFGDAGPNYAAAFRLDNGDVGTQLWRYGTVGDVQALGLSADGSRLFVGGHFGINRLRQTACGEPVQGLASLNTANGAVYCDWIPQLQPEMSNGNGPWDITMIGSDRVWVGGGYTHVAGVNQPNIASFTYDPTYKSVNYAPRLALDGLKQGGLDATYFDNINLTGTQVSRIDQTVNFNFGGGSPDPRIGPDTFSGRWTGQIEAPTSGQYVFTTRSDDGVRLFVAGETIIDNWTDHAPTDDNSGSITLEAGKRYDIQLDYYENGGGAEIRLAWQPPGQSSGVIPSTNLFHAGDTGYSTTFTGNPTQAASADLAITDVDDLNLKSARVTLTNRPDGAAESLSADTSGTAIVASYDAQTGTLNLTGSAPKADYEKVLRTVSYSNTAQSSQNEDRSISFVVNDGYVDSAVAVSTVRVQR